LTGHEHLLDTVRPDQAGWSPGRAAPPRTSWRTWFYAATSRRTHLGTRWVWARWRQAKNPLTCCIPAGQRVLPLV